MNKKYHEEDDEILKAIEENTTFPEELFDDNDVKSMLPNPNSIKKETEIFTAQFSQLLDTIASSEDKQKILWKQAFHNAVIDRMNAYMLWSDLYSKVCNKAQEHAIHGQNLSRYMERMSKANDQILKISEQIFMSKKKEDGLIISDDDIYSQLENKTK